MGLRRGGDAGAVGGRGRAATFRAPTYSRNLRFLTLAHVPAASSIPPTSLETTALRDALQRHRASLVERLEEGEDGIALGRANARFLNACFRLLFEGARRHAGLPSGVALAAVGSFGRGAVAVRSDADVVVIVDTHTVGGKEAVIPTLFVSSVRMWQQRSTRAAAVGASISSMRKRAASADGIRPALSVCT